MRRLREAGHRVVTPADCDRAGTSDTRHFAYAIREGLVLITRNARDFAERHDLILGSGGHHPGLLFVRFDNDARRDIRPGTIVVALSKLIDSGSPVADQIHDLNHWR